MRNGLHSDQNSKQDIYIYIYIRHMARASARVCDIKHETSKQFFGEFFYRMANDVISAWIDISTLTFSILVRRVSRATRMKGGRRRLNGRPRRCTALAARAITHEE